MQDNMHPLKVAICDDDPKERAVFYEMCKLVKERKKVRIKLKEYENGDAMLFDLEDTHILNTVDIILLDIHMPGKDGIDAARELRTNGFQGAIIFITGANDRWRDAFDVKAFNYITKDNDMEERFVKVFWEAIEEAKSRRDRTLLFSSLGETRQIEITTISHFEVDDHLIKVYYANERFDFISTLAKIESLVFGNDDFMRVHRSYLVSISHIVKIEDNKITMQNGQVIPLASKYAKDLKAAMAH
jgi:DNA-binding LytR/AlgR family response regulator